MGCCTGGLGERVALLWAWESLPSPEAWGLAGGHIVIWNLLELENDREMAKSQLK